DPSYRGQMVVLTHPQVGNYGVSASASESSSPPLTALIVRELADLPHHWESSQDLSSYLEHWVVPGLEGIDTRALTHRLRARGVPVMGICLGHQIIGSAAGATTPRLPFGHHGGTPPVKETESGRVAITRQNHEFQVEAGSALDASGFEVSHVSLNDGSVEGLS